VRVDPQEAVAVRLRDVVVAYSRSE
jgi:hypothetical protein